MKQVSKNLQEYTESALLVVCLWGVLPIFIILIFQHYSQEIKPLLDSLFNISRHSELVRSNLAYLIAGLIAYLVFLGHVKHKKGLIFGNDNEKGDHAVLGLMLFSTFNTFVFPLYLWYLAERYFVHFNYLNLQAAFFIGLFILINAALLNRFQQEFFKSGGFLLLSFFGVLSLIVLSFFQHGYLEIFVLFLVGGILNYASNALVLNYSRTSNSYDDLMMINSLQKEKMSISDIYNHITECNTHKSVWAVLLLVFNMNQPLILTSFIFAFIFIFIGIHENFNALSILYIHLSFILFYFRFALLSNKFPGLVSIKVDGNLIKNVFLLENSKERIIYMDKKSKFITFPEKVSLIEVKIDMK